MTDKQHQHASNKTQKTDPIVTDNKTPNKKCWLYKITGLTILTLMASSAVYITYSLISLQETLVSIDLINKETLLSAKSVEDKLGKCNLDLDAKLAHLDLNLPPAKAILVTDDKDHHPIALNVLNLVELIKLSIVLQETVANGHPFRAELLLIKDKLPITLQSDSAIKEELALLDLSSEHGVETFSSLQSKFEQDLNQYLQASNANDGYQGWLINKFLQYVKIKNISGKQKSSINNSIAITEAALQRKDLDSATQEVEKFKEIAPNLANDWLVKANISNAAKKASFALYDYFTSPEFIAKYR